jgi:hypothetical protein
VMVHDLPSLDTLAAHPEQVTDLSVPACQAALIQVAQLQSVLLSRLLSGSIGPSSSTVTSTVTENQYLTVHDVVSQFGVTKAWLYRHKAQLPHSQPSRKTLLFPEKALRRWFATRQTRDR